jgi:phosphate transport system permease protein
MTDAAAPTAPIRKTDSILVASDGMRRRNAAEARFKLYGLAAIVVSLAVLFVMLWTIFADGLSSFRQAKLTFPITLDASVLDPKGNALRDEMAKITTVSYGKILTKGFTAALEAEGIDLGEVSKKDIAALISKDAAGDLRASVLADPSTRFWRRAGSTAT